MRSARLLLLLLLPSSLAAQSPATTPPTPTLHVPAATGSAAPPSRVVFVTGDEEYRSEESMPQLARILARHGCDSTVLFAIDPKTGCIDPGVQDHLPGLEALADADLLVLFTRFRRLPDPDLQRFVDHVRNGRPVVALRTATHAFAGQATPLQARLAFDSRTWDGGFGRQVLGETWIAHHGEHGVQGTLGVLAGLEHPILRGLAGTTIWDPADVYTVRLPLPAGCTPLVFGQVLAGLRPDSGRAAPTRTADGKVERDPNQPLQPLAWCREWPADGGRKARVFTTTLGSAEAFTQEGTRRLLVHACLWALGREAAIAKDLDVSLVGDYRPSPFGFGKHKPGVRPQDLAAPAKASTVGKAP